MSTGSTSKRVESPRATDSAERTLTSCSPERPPNRSAIFKRVAMKSVYGKLCDRRAFVMNYERMFSFAVEARSGRARAGLLQTPHGVVETPAFMPVGTAAAVKAVTRQQLTDAGA